MNPILVTIGPIAVYTFGFFAALGFALATYVIWKMAKAQNWSEELIFDTVLLATLTGIVAARIFYIATHPFEFEGNLARMVLLLSHPGLSFVGGLLGGAAVALFWLKRHRVVWRAVLDVLVFGVLSAHIVGSVGCFFNACVYGLVTYLPWGVVVPGLLGRRHPIPLYFVFVDIIVLLLLLRIRERRQRPGVITAWFFTLFMLGQLFIESLRGDSVYWFGFRAHQVVAVVVGFTAAGILYRITNHSLLADVKNVAFLLTTLHRQDRIKSTSLGHVASLFTRPWRDITVAFRQWQLRGRWRKRRQRRV